MSTAELPGSVPDGQGGTNTEVKCVSSSNPGGHATLVEELSKIEKCEWDTILQVFGSQGELSDGAIELVVAASAEKLGFWRPDEELLTSCRKALRHRLAEPERKEPASRGGSESTKSGTPPEQGARLPDVTLTDIEEQPEASQSKNAPAPSGASTPKSASKGANDGPLKRRISERANSVSAWARQVSGSSKKSSKGKPNRDEQRKATTQSTHLMRGGSLNFTDSPSTNLVVDPDTVAKAKEVVKKESLLNNSNAAGGRLKQFKVALFFFVLVQMLMFAFYVVFYMTPETWDTIGLPILIARGSAYGACFWTACLFLTMSRDLISLVARQPCVRRSQLAMQLLNCYKELHVFSAYEVLLDGCLHALMHHIGTFVALEQYTNAELNDVFVCAKRKSDIPDGYIGKGIANFLEPFQFPQCPLPVDEDIGYFDGVASTPGITGYLLLLVIFSLGWFSRPKARKANFRLFYILHHLLVPSWVILLILHGANDWVGLGFPLAILVAGIPVGTYAWTRLRRNYLSHCCGAKVVTSEKSHTGKLLRLQIELPRGYYECQVGQYAYINVPEIGWSEWHPFTISSSRKELDGSQVITFCIMGVGIWTKKLSALFNDSFATPKVSIDGPFYAPTVSMPNRSTVVGIGAGVGVTPFLSFLGSMAANKGGSHKNAHIFWMSAFATDFVLFSDLLSEVDKLTSSGGCKTTFHLHATPRFGQWNGKGLGCLFELLARDVWDVWMSRWADKGQAGLPVFCKYQKPIHGVVSTGLLDSKKPVAVAVGSPDFNAELLAIGDADEKEDVFVYFCGNPFLQNMVQVACASCNEFRSAQGKSQRYYFYFERFG